MVTKRQCSFCAEEIEPGTGTMYVKRDGTIFNFCSASCRKQQLQLHRVGQRFKWTRAYALQKAAAARHSASPKDTPASRRPAPVTPAVQSPTPPAASAPVTTASTPQTSAVEASKETPKSAAPAEPNPPPVEKTPSAPKGPKTAKKKTSAKSPPA
jgi:large subunit ribosomal protein L24e